MRNSTLFGSLLVVGAGVAAYAWLIEPRWLQLVHRTIHLRTLPRSLEGFRIGLLTDLHAADGGSVQLARRAAELIMREGPHVIAITGDFAEDEGGLRNVLGALEPLRAPLGVWAVPGNHDHHAGIETWRELVDRAVGLHDLTNRFEMVEHGGSRICLGGVDDLYRGQPRLTLPPPEERDLTLLLAHTPDLAERCRRAFDAVDLVLSGHTHGGQIRLPFLPAPVNSARHRHLYENGLRRRPWTQVYTSRGIGTSGIPFRFFARPEVTLLTLTRERRPAR